MLLDIHMSSLSYMLQVKLIYVLHYLFRFVEKQIWILEINIHIRSIVCIFHNTTYS